MKQFADLHIRLNLKKFDETEQMLSKARQLGYSLVGVSLPAEVRQDTVSLLRDACISHGVDCATRVDLTPKFPQELLRSLRKFRRRFELISVDCWTKPVARQAAKDHRVDLLVFPSNNPRKRFFDNAEARLSSQSVAALEINMAPLLGVTGFHRARFLSCLRKEVNVAEKYGVPLVISSNASDYLQMRGPNDFASFASLFNMSKDSALKSVSATPTAIVERNRKKLSRSYVAKGVRVVRRAHD